MIGQTISHYRIIEKLGEGGMGVVYKAEDTKLRRSVALKFLTPEMTRDKEAKDRFIHEAQAASALDHPNIAVVHEIDDTDDGRSFICMAYYDGNTLKDELESGPLDVNHSVRIALQMADGLQRAHEAGIVHRDIKPANIIITPRGDVKIVDFGVAKLSTQTRGSSSTTGGTAAYMSPEQAQGMDVDARSDLFSLGVVMYEMMTGKRPFVADHEAALMYSIVNIDPVAPSSLNGSIPSELDRIMLKLLEKDPSKRFQTAAELRSDLKRILGSTESTHKVVVHPKIIVDKKWLAPIVALALIAFIFVFPPTRYLVDKWLGFAEPIQTYVAVLPFTNIAGDSTSQVFCDGLMEIFTSKLTNLHSTEGLFGVVPSVEIRRQGVSTPSEAWNKLHATRAITGSFMPESEKVRIILNVVDTRRVVQMDSKTLDFETSSLSEMQDKAVLVLASMLEIKAPPQVIRASLAGGTENSQAFGFYVQGRGYLKDFQKVANIDLAIRLFERALKEDSAYTLAFAALGEAYWRKYDATKDAHWVQPALYNCNRALAFDESLPFSHITLGIIHQGTGKYELAAKEFQRALEIDSLNADAYREIAKTYDMLRDTTRSELSYQKSIHLRPGYWAGYSDLGAFYYRRKRYPEAVEQFSKVIEFAPDNVRGYSSLAAVYSELQRNQEAETMLKRAIAVDSANYIPYSNLGTLYFRWGRYSEAAPMYEKSLSLAPGSHRVWGNMASSYYWTGQQGKAIEAFKRAAELAEGERKINPRDPNVLSLLADYYSILGKKTESVSLLKQALEIAPDAPDVLKRSIDIYEQLGQRDKALKQVEVSLKTGVPIQELERAPALRKLRSDLRYKSLIENLGKKP